MQKSWVSLLSVMALVAGMLLSVCVLPLADGEPANGLVETVLYESTTPLHRDANPNKDNFWFRKASAISGDALTNGVIDPANGTGEYYEITVTAKVSAGSAYLFLGENGGRWKEYCPSSADRVYLTASDEYQTITQRLYSAVQPTDYDIYVCEKGATNHVLDVSYIKVSVFRAADEPSEVVSEDVSEVVSEDVSEVSEDVSEVSEVSEDVSEVSEVSEDVSEVSEVSEDVSEVSEDVSEPQLVENVLIEKIAVGDNKWSKTAAKDAIGSWFLTVPKLRKSVQQRGAIKPEDGEYYKVTLTGYVSSGYSSLYFGENVSWEEYHGHSDAAGQTLPPSLSTTESTIEVYYTDPIFAVEGDISLCDTGDLEHTIYYTYVKVSEYRRPEHLDPSYNPNQSIGFDPTAWNRQPDQITVAFHDADATEYGVTWHTYSPEGTQVLQYVKQVGGVDDFTSAITAPAATETFQTLTMPYDREHNTFVYGHNITTVTDYAHKAALTGLDFGSTYAYRVGDPVANIWSEVGHIQTRDENQGAFTFAYVSDTQVGAAADTAQCEYMHKALQGALRNATPDFIVNGGDIVQSTKYLHLWRNQLNGSEEILRNIPCMPVTGNHDSIYAVAGDHEIYKHFNIDYPTENNVLQYGVFYSYDYGDVHFIVLNTDCFDKSGGALDATQLAWLEDDLAANTQPWTVVLMHRPMFAIRQVAVQANRAQLLGLLNDYHVDLVIQAHEHVYMRSYPIAEGVGDEEYTVLDDVTTQTVDGVEYFVDPQGVTFATFATGGANGKAPMDAADKSFCHTYGTGYASSWANITVDGDRLTVTAGYEEGGTSHLYENGTWGIRKTAPVEPESSEPESSESSEPEASEPETSESSDPDVSEGDGE